jgi:hypothetical protein
MSAWEAITWDATRAGGFTAYALLTLSVVLGLMLSAQVQSPRWPRVINDQLHTFVTLVALVFTGIHVFGAWIDPFMRFDWTEVFVPFVSHYRPLWMALGIVGTYLGIAIGLSTWLRPYIGYSWWRRLHELTLVVYGLVTAHGLATGSDTRTVWGVAIYGVSVLVVGMLLAVRLLVPVAPRGRAHPALAGLLGLVTLAGVAWTVSGPLQPGWNTVANNGQGSGARGDVGTAGQAATGQAPGARDPFAAGFSDAARGTLAHTGPDANGNVTLELKLTLTGQAPGTLDIRLAGQQYEPGGGDVSVTTTAVTLASTTGAPLYRGQVNRLSTRDTWHVGALLGGSGAANGLDVRADFVVDGGDQVSGQVTAVPVTNNGGPQAPAGATPSPVGVSE